MTWDSSNVHVAVCRGCVENHSHHVRILRSTLIGEQKYSNSALPLPRPWRCPRLADATAHERAEKQAIAELRRRAHDEGGMSFRVRLSRVPTCSCDVKRLDCLLPHIILRTVQLSCTNGTAVTCMLLHRPLGQWKVIRTLKCFNVYSGVLLSTTCSFRLHCCATIVCEGGGWQEDQSALADTRKRTVLCVGCHSVICTVTVL